MATIRTTTGALLAALLIEGCVSPAPRFEEHFGQSVRANLTAQLANPAASASTNPVDGIDGHAARAAQERYEKSFAQPDPAANSSLVKNMGE